eukprot:COSAG06_NODE_538_length_14479_cov_3.477608_10_plen_87_part_00
MATSFKDGDPGCSPENWVGADGSSNPARPTRPASRAPFSHAVTEELRIARQEALEVKQHAAAEAKIKPAPAMAMARGPDEITVASS